MASFSLTFADWFYHVFHLADNLVEVRGLQGVQVVWKESAMSGKAVNSVDKHDWKEYPLRYDPSRGYMLCRPCWDGQHWKPAYTDQHGRRWPKTSRCEKLGCGCGCTDKGPRRVKFTHEGQTDIPMDDALFIGPKAEQLKAQLEALKK